MKLLPALITISLVCGCSVFGKKKSSSKSSSAPADVAAPVVPVPGEEVPPDTSTSMKFISPADATQKVVKGASYEIALEFKNPSATATWSIFYTQTKDSVVGGLPILEDLPVATNKVSWDTSFMDPGVYYVYVVFVSETVTNVYTAPGSFKFEGNLDLNKAPVVTVASPLGDRAYLIGDSIAITFNAIDADNDPLTVKIEYTADGKTWSLVENNVEADVNQVEWIVPADAVPGARYQIRVVATDGKLSSEATNGKVFGVWTAPVVYSGQIDTLFMDNCNVACHNNVVPSTLLLTDFAQANAARASILDRTRLTSATPMPPKNDAAGRTLTDAERDLIQLWIWNNGLQN